MEARAGVQGPNRAGAAVGEAVRRGVQARAAGMHHRPRERPDVSRPETVVRERADRTAAERRMRERGPREGTRERMHATTAGVECTAASHVKRGAAAEVPTAAEVTATATASEMAAAATASEMAAAATATPAGERALRTSE